MHYALRIIGLACLCAGIGAAAMAGTWAMFTSNWMFDWAAFPLSLVPAIVLFCFIFGTVVIAAQLMDGKSPFNAGLEVISADSLLSSLAGHLAGVGLYLLLSGLFTASWLVAMWLLPLGALFAVAAHAHKVYRLVS